MTSGKKRLVRVRAGVWCFDCEENEGDGGCDSGGRDSGGWITLGDENLVLKRMKGSF